MFEHFPLIINERGIFYRAVYPDVDCHVPVQFRAVNSVNLLNLCKSRPLALFGR